nr:SIR2 family protein [Rhodococcus sp. B10]
MGDKAVQRVIRESVLDCCTSISREEKSRAINDIGFAKLIERDHDWKIPQATARFAEFYAGLPDLVRGPIVTTNFDPFIEIALRQIGVSAEAVPISFDTVPNAEQLSEKTACQILHIHGFWRSNVSLNTISQLTRARPAVSRLVRNMFQNALILAVGYGGWRDAFMSSLEECIKEDDLYDSELCWAAYDADPTKSLDNEILGSLDGRSGFTLYVGIDALELFSGAIADSGTNGEPLVGPPGYFRLPVKIDGNADDNRLTFADGGQPQWKDAVFEEWPLLESGQELLGELRKVLESGGGGGAVAIGPMGEGKSIALKQVALQAASLFEEEWTFFWREAGAPQLTAEWISEARQRYGKICLCVDDADLVADSIGSSRRAWAGTGSGVAFLLASQDRLWWPRAASVHTELEVVIFHGLKDSDAHAIASSWVEKGLLGQIEEDAKNQVVSRYSTRLQASASSLDGVADDTLMGAVLDVRFTQGLRERIVDLVDKLMRIPASNEVDVTIADVFGAICLMQDMFDRNGNLSRGLSRAVINKMIPSEDLLFDAKILKILGREALISLAGNRVYARHQSIARVVVEDLRTRLRMSHICMVVAKAGAACKRDREVNLDEYRDAFLIGKLLKDEAEIRAAATGAVAGYPALLQARINYASQTRAFAAAGSFENFGTLAQNLDSFDDTSSVLRIFLNEYSQLARRNDEPQLGLGLSLLSLLDGFPYELESEQAAYGLKSLIDCSLAIRKQAGGIAKELPEVGFSLLVHVRGLAAAKVHIRVADLDSAILQSWMDCEMNRCVQYLQANAASFANEARMRLNSSQLPRSGTALLGLKRLESNVA